MCFVHRVGAKVVKTIENIFINPFGKAKTLRIFAPRFCKIISKKE